MKSLTFFCNNTDDTDGSGNYACNEELMKKINGCEIFCVSLQSKKRKETLIFAP